MKSINDSIAFVINVHKRLIREFPMTPYICWCQRVHSLKISPLQKWEYILQWDLNPSEYDNPTLFRYDWQAFKFLSKFCPGGKPSEQDTDVAYRKFRSAEGRCARVNRFLNRGNLPSGVAELLHNAKNIFSSVIGTTDEFLSWIAINVRNDGLTLSFDRFSDRYGRVSTSSDSLCPQFGPGISVGSSANDKLKTVGEKIVLGTCTAGARRWVEAMREVWPGLFPVPRIVRGSVLTFVPKRVGEARTIKYAPSMNMALQKLVGQYLRYRLKACLGIDLSNQERNRSLAQLGSLCNSYVTQDLSSASDLNCVSLIRELAPWPWFSFLDDIREKEYFDPIRKNWLTAHKFSAMGNGFTFELESLVFAAIVKSAICRVEPIGWKEISVYGDDLIYPKRFYHDVSQALIVLGHLPNAEKSFSDGPFRESCGGDYFNGWNVTPFKIKDLSLNEPKTVVNLYNGLYISSREDPGFTDFCPRFTHALAYVRDWLQRNFKRISEGHIEIPTYSDTLRCPIPQPSNRWLWSVSPVLNCTYSIYTNNLQPRSLLSYKIRQSDPSRRPTYDYHPDTLLYRIRWGEQPIEDEKVQGFIRNPALFAKYKCKRRFVRSADLTNAL